MAEGIWLRLAYRGEGGRLWRAIAESGARVRRIVQQHGQIELDVPIGDLMALRRALAGQGRLAVLGHGGWPLMLRALRRRPWRLVWPALALLLYAFAAGHIWQVAVVGPNGIPKARILAAAHRLGLRQGALRAALDPYRIGQQIPLQVPGLIFAAVRVDGVRAVIYAAPDWRPAKPEPPAARGALFAAERGYVTRVVVLQGLPLVKSGDTVVRGEPLVAPRGGSSRGEVFARVWRSYHYTFPVRSRRSYATGRRATRWYISLPMGRQWTPQGSTKPFGQARRTATIWRIPLGSVEVGRYTYVELRTLKVVRSATYVELRATSLALATVKRSMPGAKLLALRTQVRRVGGNLQAVVSVEAETDIAHAKAGGRTQD